MSSLSDKELAQAAAEAGISPEELKEALARRASGEIAEKQDKSATTKTHGTIHARFSRPPSQAFAHVHRVFSQQVDYVPTRSKDGQIRYVNKRLGFAYRLNSESDGTPTGALVRVDIDVSQRMKQFQRRILPITALGAVFFLLVGGFPASSYIAFGAFSVLSVFQTRKQTLKFAQETARIALDRANQNARGVLPSR